MKKKMAFRLNGQGLSLTPKPPAVIKAIEYLDNLKDGELVSCIELAEILGYHWHGFQTMSRHSALSAYSAVIRFPTRRKVMGNKRTIKELLTHKDLIHEIE